MKYLLTSDIHLTDAAKDSYRFGLFDFLRQQQEIYNPDVLIVAGDLTNEKNYHSSALVNQTVEGFKRLRPPVYIDRGNHDGDDPENPFFAFLNKIPGITFCIDTTVIKDYKLVMIPHQLNQASFDNAFKRVPEGFLAVCHQTITGCLSETGSRLTGLAVPPNKACKILSGDIHRPQILHTENGDVTYIGSPYAVRHGDHFEPRVLLLDNNKEIDLHFLAPKKLSLIIRDVSEIPDLKKGDQIKVLMELHPSEKVEWANHKKKIMDHCKDKGIEIYGAKLKVIEGRKRPKLTASSNSKSNLDYFKAFCVSEQIPANIKQAGLNIIEDEV